MEGNLDDDDASTTVTTDDDDGDDGKVATSIDTTKRRRNDDICLLVEWERDIVVAADIWCFSALKTDFYRVDCLYSRNWSYEGLIALRVSIVDWFRFLYCNFLVIIHCDSVNLSDATNIEYKIMILWPQGNKIFERGHARSAYYS